MKPNLVKIDPAKLRVVIYPEPVLKKVAADVADFDKWLAEVVQRMTELMVEHKGVGLAAPQVGLPLRLFIMSPSGKAEDARAIVNPVISEESGQEEMEEGCLSLPDIRAKVLRYTHLHLDAQDAAGKKIASIFEEYPARIIQHENDHLNGILLIDRMSPMAKLANRKKIKELESKGKGKK
jgi:peptide deformylase